MSTIDLFDNATDKLIGSITEPELQHMMEILEEESESDQDYYIDQATIDLLGGDGRATDHLLNLLRTALGDRDGIDVRWERR